MSKCMPIDTAINVYNCTTQSAIDRFMATTKTPKNLKIAQRLIRPGATKPYEYGHLEFTAKNDIPAKAAVARALVQDAGLRDLISRVLRELERPSDMTALPTVHFFENAIGVTFQSDMYDESAGLMISDRSRLIVHQAFSAQDALLQRATFDALVGQWNTILIDRGLSVFGMKPPRLDMLLTAPPAYLTQYNAPDNHMPKTLANTDSIQRCA